MKASTISNANDMIFALQDEIRRNDEAKYDHRLHAVLLVAHGMSCRQVGQKLGDSARTVAYWIRRFEDEGFAGLVDGDRPGRPPRLSEAQLGQIDQALRREPKEFGLQGPWDGKVLSSFIQQQWGISLGMRQCQRLFRQLGFRLRTPRPKMAKADPALQEEYKKTP
jgi:transposase